MMIVLAFAILKCILVTMYLFMKLLPTNNNKITFLSRQSNVVTLDFSMLVEEIARRSPKIKIVTICKRTEKGLKNQLGFALTTIISMYHIATSKVCILDSYWPAISILNHKRSLRVIQLWHAMGKIKQSGYQTIGMSDGRNKKIAGMLSMHRNYDLIIAGGEAWNTYYCKSFDTTVDKLRNVGLPRIDYLLMEEKKVRERVLKEYPEFSEKPVVLYAPTFRKNRSLDCTDFVRTFDFKRFYLVIKEHANQKIVYEKKHKVYRCRNFSSQDILTVCEYLITDYSAIALEGAVLNRKTYYYLFDNDEYLVSNGVNINLFDEMPGCVFIKAEELNKALSKGSYDVQALEHYREKYLPKELGTSTERIIDIVEEIIGSR